MLMMLHHMLSTSLSSAPVPGHHTASRHLKLMLHLAMWHTIIAHYQASKRCCKHTRCSPPLAAAAIKACLQCAASSTHTSAAAASLSPAGCLSPPPQHPDILPCRVSARDSGKVMLDAVLGEVIVTCEKLHWLIHEAEQHLKPEKRASGVLVSA